MRTLTNQFTNAARPALLAFLAVFACMAQDSRITQQQADGILNELRQIRQLLERQDRPPAPVPKPVTPQTGKLKLGRGYSLGSDDAPITIVEFTDYQCPFCRQFQNTTLAGIRRKYVDTGKVRFIIRDLPLNFHTNAMRAAEAAHCAADQNQFWRMHDLLFTDPAKLGEKELIERADALNLDLGMFRSCVESGRHKREIEEDMQAASALQIMGTPSFLIGKAAGDEVAGAIVVGAQPLSVFEAKIKEAAGID